MGGGGHQTKKRVDGTSGETRELQVRRDRGGVSDGGALCTSRSHKGRRYDGAITILPTGPHDTWLRKTDRGVTVE